MKFKKIFITILLAVMVVMPFAVKNVNAEETKTDTQETEETEDKKVKVYVFEAGGCPYCEMQYEYLEGLEGYNKTFEVIKKEAFVDHNTWAQGADYNLAMEVADAFTNAGFTDAELSGTPYVVISNLYAVSAYSDSIESIIEQAYEEGDKDVVGCIERGEDNCMPEPEPDGSETVAAIVVCVAIVAVIVFAFVSRSRTENVYEDDEREDAPKKKAEKMETPVVVEEKSKEKKTTAKKETTTEKKAAGKKTSKAKKTTKKTTKK